MPTPLPAALAPLEMQQPIVFSWNWDKFRLGNIQLGVIGWLIESDQDIF
jgi:hypothetical protein